MNIRHIHSSSRYDRSDSSLAAAATRYNKKADIITYTEVEREARENVIHKVGGKDFGFISGDNSYANDCGIAFRKSRFNLVYRENFKSTNTPFYDKGGRQRDPQWSTNAVLLDKHTGKKLVVAVIHLASGIEGDMTLGRKTKAIKNWHDSFNGAKKRANKLKRKHRAHGILFVADFNVNFHQVRFRALVKTSAPLYRLTWVKLPAGGTHGRRLIDGSLISGDIGVKRTAELFRDDDSSDHRPYYEELVWL